MNELEILIEELEAAAANHRDAEEGRPHINLARLLAVAHTCYGDNDLAVPHARTVLANSIDAEMHFLLGVEAERRDAEDEALEQYEAALAIDPKFWRALFHVGKICLLNGWTADAVDYLEQVAAINPGHMPTVAFLARYGDEELTDEEAVTSPLPLPEVHIELPKNGELPEGLQ
jgi:tetratricopeptide (TPR) repeat protein